MNPASRLLAGILLAPAVAAQAPAQDLDQTRAINALRDQARAHERQADELHRLRQIEADRAVQEDRAQRNAARDARSARRFDRH